VCSGCLNSIEDEDCIEAVEQNWHLDCFRCSACDSPLSSWYFEKDGLLFCKNDYWGKYGECCQGCSEVSLFPNHYNYNRILCGMQAGLPSQALPNMKEK